MSSVPAHPTSHPPDASSPPADPSASDIPRIDLHDIMRNRREIDIRHAGRTYRLRITSQDKLILTA